MKKSSSSDGILVFDRYYSRKPVSAVLAAERVLFCVCVAVFSMLYVFSQYDMSVSLGYIAAVSAIGTALFSVLFIFVKRRIAVPAIIVVAAWMIWINFEDFWQRFTYFIDEAMLLVEGRFLFPRGYLLHEENRLTPANPLYSEGMLIGSLILCTVFALVCAASMRKRVRTAPSLLLFLLLCVPRILSETLEINLWFVPVALLFAASVAIEINYINGLAVVRDSASLYRKQVRQEERSFIKHTRKAPFIKRLGMHFNFYSKYSTSGFYSATAFGLALLVGFSVFGAGKSIDYSGIYSILFDVGDELDADASDEGPIADYFTSPRDDGEADMLNIISPGTGEKSVLDVTFTGDEPIYLRGDIGIDFTGKGWTTSVGNDQRWLETPMAHSYRPCELNIFSVLLDVLNESGLSVSSESSISIEYLCETDVVFLPAYTADYSYYSNPNFNVYGDYAVRVSEAAGNYINSVQCTALLHKFGYDSSEASAVLEEALTVIKQNDLSVNDFYETVIPEMSGNHDVLENYSSFVESTYTEVPWQLYDPLVRYLKDNGLYDDMFRYSSAIYSEVNDTVRRYNAALTLNDFLRDNYTYSLSAENEGDDAILHFLNETKSGHCALYASSMTLLLRSVNIPARYCTGFSIYPDMIIGNRTELKEKNLHAWVEVYLDELGWVTFDPTSAALHEMAGVSDTHPDHPEYPEYEETETSPPQTSDVPSVDQPDETKEVFAPSDSTEYRFPTEVVIVIGCIALVVALVVLVILRYRTIRNRAEAILAGCYAYSAADIYSCIVDLLYRCGLYTKQGQLPSQYYGHCDEVLGTTLSADSDLLEAAAFGSSDYDEEMSSALADELASVYSAALDRGGIIHKYCIRKQIIVRFSRSTKMKH